MVTKILVMLDLMVSQTGKLRARKISLRSVGSGRGWVRRRWVVSAGEERGGVSQLSPSALQ